MNRRLKHIATTAALVAGLSAPLSAFAGFIDSVIAENGNTYVTNASNTALIGTFSFSNPATSLADLTGVQLTLTVTDGDTAAGNYDTGNLSLTLDGYNTGLVLNGFANSQTTTQTLSISGAGLQHGADIFAALVADNQLVARIADLTNDGGNDNGTGIPKNTLSFPRTSNATLGLTGTTPVAVNANAVPEPASLALLGMGLFGLALGRRGKKTS